MKELVIKPRWQVFIGVNIFTYPFAFMYVVVLLFIFRHDFDLVTIFTLSILINLLSAIAFLPSMFFESVTFDDKNIIYTHLGVKKVFPISKIKEVSEEIMFKKMCFMVVTTSNDSFKFQYTKFPKTGVKSLLNQIKKSNAKISIDRALLNG